MGSANTASMGGQDAWIMPGITMRYWHKYIAWQEGQLCTCVPSPDLGDKSADGGQAAVEACDH